MAINRKKYIEQFIKIKTKAGNIESFIFNEPQNILYDAIKEQANNNKPIRILILKSRQMGISTEVESIVLTNTVTNFNVSTGIIAHQSEATKNLYEMSRLMYDNLPDKLKPAIQKSNANELVFNRDDGKGLNSRIKCMTAGSHGVGRSNTYQFLHLSEFAFWPGNKKDTLNGLLQCVPSLPNTAVFIETTANGFEYFKELWDRAVEGENDFIPVFIPWFKMKEYSMPYTGFELTKDEEEMKELYSLTNEQLEWRRWCLKNNCDNDIDQFKQEYPSNPDEAFLSTGSCIFDKDTVTTRIQQTVKPIKKGFFKYDYDGLHITNIHFEENEKGCISIWKMPKQGYPYVLGGDPAGIGADDFCGDVINNITSEQVATLEIQTDEDLYARQMYCLGRFYNDALISIETNYSTYPVKELYRLEYPKQYVRNIDNVVNIKYQDKLGFNTNTASKPILLANLVKFVRETAYLINNPKTLKQMLTFIKKENGKQEAEDGYHDDRVMSLGITLISREQQSFIIEKKEEDKKISWPDPLRTEEDDDYYEDNEIIGW